MDNIKQPIILQATSSIHLLNIKYKSRTDK